MAEKQLGTAPSSPTDAATKTYVDTAISGAISTTAALSAGNLTATSVKTANYTAAASEIVPCNATGGAFTVTLPANPTDNTRIVVKKIDSSVNAVTVQCSGEDKFDSATGSSSLALSIPGQTISVHYEPGIWFVVGGASSGTSNSFAATIGNGSATSIAVTHNLGTMDVVVSVHLVSTGEIVDCDIVKTSGNVVTLNFAAAPASNSLRCTVIGTAFGVGTPSPVSSAGITDATSIGRSVLTAADAAAVRTAIGAGTSSLALGTTSSTAKAGDYQPSSTNISDSTATGRAVLTAASTMAAKAAINADFYVNVKDYGAVGDWQTNTQTGTDNTAAFVAAAAAAGGSKKIYVPAGNYRLASEFSLSTVGAWLEGEFANTTLYIDHPGVGVRIATREITVANLSIRSSTARASLPYSNDNIGLLVAAPVTPVSHTRTRIDHINILDQPGHGFVFTNYAYFSIYSRLLAQNNKGHGFVIDSGETVGRYAFSPGIVTLQHPWALGNGGHGLVIGNPTAYDLPFRILVDNFDCSGNALDPAVRYSRDEIWAFGENCEIRRSAFGTIPPAPTAASGNGSTATLTFDSTPRCEVGDTVAVLGMNPSGYDGTYTVTAASTSAPWTVSYASSTTGSLVGGGTPTLVNVSRTGVRLLGPNWVAINNRVIGLGRGFTLSGALPIPTTASPTGSRIESFRAIPVTPEGVVIESGVSNAYVFLPSTVNLTTPVTDNAAPVNANVVTTMPIQVAQPTLLATNHDYSWPLGKNTLRLASATGGSVITGLTNPSTGRQVRLINGGTDTITLTHADTRSSANNRIHCPAAVDFPLLAGASVLLEWDNTANTRWRIVSADTNAPVCVTANGGTGSENGANTWAKLAVIATGLVANSDTALTLTVVNGATTQLDTATISLLVRTGAINAAPTVAVSMTAKAGAGTHITADSFKVISDGWSSNVELWMKKGATFGGFSVYELGRKVTLGQAIAINYTVAPPWQSATPTGSVNNVSTTGVTAFGIPVVTTTATQTLSGKTLQVADGLLVNHSSNGNLLGFGSVASGDSYVEIANNISGSAPRVSAVGTATNVPLSLGSKGTGNIFFRANNVANSFAVTSAASSGNVNYLQVNQVAAGSTPSLSVAGSFDTNVNVNIVPKGTGTVQANGVTVATRLTNTATLDFGSVSAQSFADLTITVTGAATGDAVALGTPTTAIPAGIAYTAWVSATDTVTVRSHNYTSGPLDPASGTFRATIIR